MAPRDPRSDDDPPRATPNAIPPKGTPSPEQGGDRHLVAPKMSRKKPTSAAKSTTATGVKFLTDEEPAESQEPKSLPEQIKHVLAQGVTGFAVSVSLHIAVFVVLGLMVFTRAEGPEEKSGFIGTWIPPEAFAEQERRSAQDREPIEIAAVTSDSIPVASQESKGTSTSSTRANSDNGQEQKFVSGSGAKVGQGLTGRTAAQKSSLLKHFGGTKQSEDAVGRGLSWLARNQQSDGRWELHRGYDNPGRENLRTDTGATSLSLLCFLGAGYTHQDGKYKDVVRKGLDWLKKIQQSDGNLHDWEELGRQTAFYAHGQGTIVLCEAYGMTHDSELLEPAKKALQFIYDSQNEHGGWQYQPGAVGDLSVTGWQVMAIQSARMAGFEVPDDVLARVTLFLNSVSSQQGRRYRYKAADPESLFSPAMTAEGLLCRQYLGWKRDHPALKEATGWLLEQENLPHWTAGRRNVYYWYYATQVMHHMEGDAWETWNGALRDQISAAQSKSGKLSGSWHPSNPQGDNHEYGEAGGRLYVTCLSILTLEVYYRHLPLYRE